MSARGPVRARRGRRAPRLALAAALALAPAPALAQQPPAPPAPPAAPPSAPAAAPAAAPPATPPAARRGVVRADSLWSSALGRWARLVVYLPPSYATDSVGRHAVAYYLHGHGGRETDWTRQGRLAETADSLIALGMPELIVVMPDGDDGWYTTWPEGSPPDSACAAASCPDRPRYDLYVARDVVAHVDSTYRTLPARQHRAVAGLSMGGYGAVTLALAFPATFGVAASHSGTLSLLHRPAADSLAAPEDAYAADTTELAAIWKGLWPSVRRAFGRDTASWRARDPVALIVRARTAGAALPRLYLDVGRADPFAHQTLDLHRTLHRLAVPHEFALRDGTHDWAYWRRWLAASLWWIAKEQ